MAIGNALKTNDSEEHEATKIREAPSSREWRRYMLLVCNGQQGFLETLRFRARQTDRVWLFYCPLASAFARY